MPIRSTASTLAYHVVVTANRKAIAAFTGLGADQAAENRLNDVQRRNLYGQGCHVVTVWSPRKPRAGSLV